MGPAYFDPQSKFLVLDLLVDGPGSYMSLYGELTRFHAFPPDVNLLMNHLEAHEADGHIELLVSVGGGNLAKAFPEDRARAREQYQDLVRNRSDDFAVDEIGFWYFLTPLGRDVWQAAGATPGDEPAPWVIQEDGRSAQEAMREHTRPCDRLGECISRGHRIVQVGERTRSQTSGAASRPIRDRG